MMFSKLYKRVGLFCAAALLAGASQASLLLDASSTSTYTSSYGAANYVAGTAFTVTDTLTIDGLGWLDAEGNGLSGSHTVGLWNAAGTLIASATVTNAGTQVLSAQGRAVWYLAEIDDLVLTSGTYRVAGSMLTDATAYLNNIVGNGVGVVPGYVRNNIGAGYGYPSQSWGGNVIHATVSSHQFDPAAPATDVPEPGSLALVGLALGGMGLARRRRR